MSEKTMRIGDAVFEATSRGFGVREEPFRSADGARCYRVWIQITPAEVRALADLMEQAEADTQ